MRQRTMIVAGRLEPDNDGPAEGGELLGEAVIVRLARERRHAPAPPALGPLDEPSWRFFAMSIATSTAPAGVEENLVMVGRPPKCCLDNLTLDTC